jgi:hypothetical protein
VARHIAQRAAAVIVKAPPVERLVEIISALVGVAFAAHSERPGRRNALPKIPVEPGDYRSRIGHFGETLRPDRPIGPGMHFRDVADYARPDHLGALPRAFVGVTLVAHLGGHSVLISHLAHLPRFPNGADERFLHVNVLAAFHRPDGRGGMHEIGNGDNHRVDAFFLVEHLAEVFVPFCIGVFVERPRVLIVDIAKRHDIFRSAAVNIG